MTTTNTTPAPVVAPLTPTQKLLTDCWASNYAKAMIPRFGRERTARMLAKARGTSLTAARNALRYW